MTINASIQNSRGLMDPKKPKDLNTLNTLTIYEAMTPYATTHDDPIRTAMGFVQTVKHQMRVKSSSPSLITYGMDEALPYFTTDIFSHKFKGVKGKVLDVNDEFIIYETIDEDGNKSKEFVDFVSRGQTLITTKEFVVKGINEISKIPLFYGSGIGGGGGDDAAAEHESRNIICGALHRGSSLQHGGFELLHC